MMMDIDANNILRHLPAFIEPKARLSFDVLLYSYDIARVAYYALVEACRQFDYVNRSPKTIASMFSSAWSMIDQIDISRQMLATAAGPRGPLTTEFLDLATAARKMRNGMDHVVQRLDNLSSRKGRVESIFGAIGFVRCDEEVIDNAVIGDLIRCEIVIIARGAMPTESAAATTRFSTYDVNREISNLTFSWDGTTINLDRAAYLLSEIIVGQCEEIESQLKVLIPKLMKKKKSKNLLCVNLIQVRCLW